jgi:hypothetical protein
MADPLVCWKCGESIEALPLPLSRTAECPGCGAELHVCRLCEFYDLSVAHACREPVAEEVMDKERANFCGYFQPRRRAYTPAQDAEAQAARAQLHALFGEPDDADTPAQGEAADSEQEAARRRLEDLFRSDDDKKD